VNRQWTKRFDVVQAVGEFRKARARALLCCAVRGRGGGGAAADCSGGGASRGTFGVWSRAVVLEL
jgi:hypothetical protein